MLLAGNRVWAVCSAVGGWCQWVGVCRILDSCLVWPSRCGGMVLLADLITRYSRWFGR